MTTRTIFFSPLALFDRPERGGNADGRIDRRDALYEKLRPWRDADHNGRSEPGELRTLSGLGSEASDLGSEASDLNYRESKRVDAQGNRFK